MGATIEDDDPEGIGSPAPAFFRPSSSFWAKPKGSPRKKEKLKGPINPLLFKILFFWGKLWKDLKLKGKVILDLFLDSFLYVKMNSKGTHVCEKENE